MKIFFINTRETTTGERNMSYGINGFDAYLNEDNLKKYTRQDVSQQTSYSYNIFNEAPQGTTGSYDIFNESGQGTQAAYTNTGSNSGSIFSDAYMQAGTGSSSTDWYNKAYEGITQDYYTQIEQI